MEKLLEKETGEDFRNRNKMIVFKEKPIYDFFKRLFDIVISFSSLLILSPFLLIIMLIIYIEDKGNPIFIQKRAGKNEKEFNIYKFRTMHINAEKYRDDLLKYNEADGPLFKIQNDPRITKVGRILRKSSLDELPQIINVLKGDMSIIGPRPFVPYEQDKCNDYQKQRVFVKPGLSCFASLSEKSRDSFDYWIEMDLKYIRERSFSVDLAIIFKTMGVVLLHKNY